MNSQNEPTRTLSREGHTEEKILINNKNWGWQGTNLLPWKLVNKGKVIYPAFPIEAAPLSNQIIDKGQCLFTRVFQLITKTDTIELEYHHFATPNQLLIIGIGQKTAINLAKDNQMWCASQWQNTPLPTAMATWVC